MDEVKDQEWVIDEDELALENSIFKKHQGEHEPRSEKKKENIIFPSRKKISIIKKTKEIPSYIGEKITFFLLLIIFPYRLF